MENNLKLPVYKFKISEEESDMEIYKEQIALTNDPANDMSFFAFNKMVPMEFTADDERQIITGIAMVANQPIYRDMEIYEGGKKVKKKFYGYFSPEEIEKYVYKFFKYKYNDNFNINHKKGKIEDVYIFESTIIDKRRGTLPPEMFKGVSDGSWAISIKVDSKESWKIIKDEGLIGFSVQGLMGVEPTGVTEDVDVLETIAEIVTGA